MKIFTAAGSIHIEDDDPFLSFCGYEIGIDVRDDAPRDSIFLVPVVKDGDIVRHARTGEELARKIGVITNLG